MKIIQSGRRANVLKYRTTCDVPKGTVFIVSYYGSQNKPRWGSHEHCPGTFLKLSGSKWTRLVRYDDPDRGTIGEFTNYDYNSTFPTDQEWVVEFYEESVLNLGPRS